MAEYADLLAGLDSEDFNDLDDVDTGGGGPGGTINAEESPEEEEAWDEDPLYEKLEQALSKQGAIGFTTAGAKALPPPSKSAMDRIRKLFDEADAEANPTTAEEEPQVQTPDVANKRRKLGDGGSLFTTGSGASLVPPSRDARAKAALLFGERDDHPPATSSTSLFVTGSGGIAPPPSHRPATPKTAQAFGDTPSRSSSSSSRSMFTSGTGQAPPAFAPPSAVARVADLFADADADAMLATPEAGPSRSGFMLASGQAAPPPSKAAMARAMAIFGEIEADTALEEAPDTAPLSSSVTHLPVQAPITQSTPFAPPRPTRTHSPSPAFRTPSRTPLRTTTNTFSVPSPAPSVSKPTRPIEIKSTPSSLGPRRRIGLGGGATPSSSAKGKSQKGFTTPFKKPSALGGRSSPAPSLLRSSVAGPSSITNSVAKTMPQPVFDLTAPPNRRNLVEARLHPGYYSDNELAEMGLYDEIWHLNLSNAADYHFVSEQATMLDWRVALEVLKREQCHLATAKWVRNHWELILWKIAGEIRAQPGLFDEKWNWGEVIDQLKYRYEREFGMAQRPIIRRIHEHDSSPSLPMVLCVSGVTYPPPGEDESGKEVQVRPYLELTDGWYRITAEVDECLERAIRKGKIVVGRKLGVSGARLVSGPDGSDALDSPDSSHLVLSGNSCHLAKWHAKLGLQAEPFVAGLSSLTVDGGPIVLMDVRLEKVYPLAFVHAEKGVKEGPWGETEEQKRDDQWREKYIAEMGKLQETMQKRLEKVEDLAGLLSSHAEDVSARPDNSPPDTLEQDYEALLDAKDVSARVRTMPGQHILHLAEYARGRMQAEMSDGQGEIEKELQTVCPPRNVRDFRMVRFVDAQEGRKDPARVGMLNVWDARALGEGMLQEGKRYLVSNVMPGRQGDWFNLRPGRRAEIYLHTRRDTRWQLVDEAA